ncbi:MAG: FimV/HubP family polar landmark protein [Moraxellaceae bacterium]|nr:FimV/HubP family polar landmark protein [Moraxellaceae bacterium]MDP1775882.1 FimV/HubP family polar landmark protein [Moraxellaceae bacterium]MDZ4298272.1 FimV/HubP family polar landmark protein [Moraxellaceae bacterium]MDZ4387003.1 FimV/HubP family polar landmark protein [Moraxellaceae bacterium]
MGSLLRRIILVSLGVGVGLLFSAILSQRAQAFTITEMRALSAQAEPLKIQLLIDDLDSRVEGQLSVRIAEAADHERYGLQRPDWADQAQFLVQSLGAERTRIMIDAPYSPNTNLATLLLEFSWPGRLRVQQVGVRLPATQAPAVTSHIIKATPPVVMSVVPSSPQARPFVDAAASEPAANVVIPVRGDQVHVRTGDTLSQIANDWQAQGLTLAQKAQVIAEQNPRAFINGNPNLLRRDARLTLPSVDTLPISDAQAAQDWLVQASSVTDTASQAVVVGDESIPLSSDTNTTPQEITLTLVGEGASAGGSAGEGEAADADAVVRQGLIERGQELTDRREELRQRLVDVKAESTDLEQRLQVVDERLAAMTGQLTEINEFVEEADAEPVAALLDDAKESAAKSWFAAIPGHTLFAWFLAFLVMVFLLLMYLYDRLFNRQPAPVIVVSDRQDPVVSATAVAAETVEDLTPVESAAYVPLAESIDPDDDEYDFMTDAQEQAQQTRLDLAQAYIEMKLDDSARHLLTVVAEQGNEAQRETARELLAKLG